METIGKVMQDALQGPQRRREHPSRASIRVTNNEESETILRDSEARARGYKSDKPAPEPVTCQFCGRTLEYRAMVIPGMEPRRIFGWLPEPERCTCPQAVEYWDRADREAQERKEAEERRKEQAALQAKINRLIKNSGIGGRFQNRTFARYEVNDENRRAFNQCKRYADSFGIMLPTKDRDGKVEPPAKERNGLFMVGSYGTGKTHLAAAIANQLMQDGTAVICMTMIDMLARIRDTYDRARAEGTSEAQIMKLYADVPLLIIDDLGSEQATDWSSTTIFSIINARYERYMPTIVTTNCGTDELVQRMTPRDASDRNARKTIERLQEVCVGIEMYWPSWRTK